MKEFGHWAWQRILSRWLVAISLAAIVLTGSSAIGQTINVDRVVAELEPEIQRAMIEGRIPSASIALIAGDRVIWKSAYGYSNLWARTPATPSTVYLIGSTFKTMSTFALLQQMEQGKFKLDDRVNDYLTDFKIENEDPKHPVTCRPIRERGQTLHQANLTCESIDGET